MAEAIGAASALVGLATFAGQCSVALYETVMSYQSHQQRVRDLVEETSALSDVLRSLTDTARANPELHIPALAIPLKRCARACQEFEQEIKKFSSRSVGGRTSLRDWARLRYMGEDVDGFRRLLSGYKMTITVALTDASLRRSLLTADAVEGYTELLNTAREDLESRLEMIDDKLDRMLGQNIAGIDSNGDEVAQIKEERQSTEQSLRICAQLSEHITQAQLANANRPPRSDDKGNTKLGSVSEKITSDGLQECKESLGRMAAKLASHEKQLFDRLIAKMTATSSSPAAAAAADIARLRDEWESARESMNLLSSANSQLEKSVSVIENHATGDAIQFMVSTKGKVLHGTNKGLGWRSRQVGGYLEDETVAQISRDMTNISFRSAKAPELVSGGEDAPRSALNEEFKERYGEGYTLTSPSVDPQPLQR